MQRLRLTVVCVVILGVFAGAALGQGISWSESGGTLGSINVSIDIHFRPSARSDFGPASARSSYSRHEFDPAARTKAELPSLGDLLKPIADLFDAIFDLADRVTKPLRDLVQTIHDNWRRERERREELERTIEEWRTRKGERIIGLQVRLQAGVADMAGWSLPRRRAAMEAAAAESRTLNSVSIHVQRNKEHKRLAEAKGMGLDHAGGQALAEEGRLKARAITEFSRLPWLDRAYDKTKAWLGTLIKPPVKPAQYREWLDSDRLIRLDTEVWGGEYPRRK